MGVQSQKKNLLNDSHSGLSPKRAAKRLRDILAEKNPGVNLLQISHEFKLRLDISLLSLCEIWHQLRTKTKTLDAVAEAFASKLALLNQHNRRLEQIIKAQREELAKRNAGSLPRSAVEAEVRQQRESTNHKQNAGG